MEKVMYQLPFKSIPPFAEKRGPRQREADLREVVRSMQALLPQRLSGNIDIVLADQELPVMVDMAQIEVAFLNLIQNAQEAMPTGGRLTIKTGSARLNGNSIGKGNRCGANTCAFVSVSDTGSGMDEQTLERIFEPFYTTKEGTHQGLGLPMVYHTIREHDGNINIETRPGHGTTVKVYLPLLRKTAARPKAIPLPPAGAYASLRLREW